ncbi:zinc-alpha-2-glycoprotein-like isoform X2 [Salminus brasiliensis]|uniref:zinc-alpha-2-glycoprotein-like isoform X2 n=1 Tax=Salminus brasiliensis TaxID=930266 RepID=UPI003B831FE9
MRTSSAALLLFSFLLNVVGEKHSLNYLYTIQSSHTDNIYSSTAVTLLNHKQIDFYNSSDESRSRKEGWMQRISESDWNSGTEKLKFDGQWINKLINRLMNEFRHNKSDGHVLQWRHGCEGEGHPDGSVTLLNSINDYAYDGEDLISFNCSSQTWSTSEEQKNREKEEKWKSDYHGIAVKKCEQCEEMLKMYLQYNTTDSKPRQTPPAVHMFAKTPVRHSSKLNLTCMATGFNPKDLVMSVRKYSTSLPEHLLTSSGVRPNDDGTYQLRKSVEIPEDDYTADYNCYVSHISLNVAVIKNWDGNCNNCSNKKALIIGGVVVTTLCVLGLILWVLKKKGIICVGIPSGPPPIINGSSGPPSSNGLPPVPAGAGSPSGSLPTSNGNGSTGISPSVSPSTSNGNVSTGAGIPSGSPPIINGAESPRVSVSTNNGHAAYYQVPTDDDSS